MMGRVEKMAGGLESKVGMKGGKGGRKEGWQLIKGGKEVVVDVTTLKMARKPVKLQKEIPAGSLTEK